MERGLTVFWALMALLLVAGASEDSQEPSGSDNEVASGPEDLGPLPPLNNIDPNLRRALLQALTNLEEEAKQRLQDQQPSEDDDKVQDSPPEPEVVTTTAAPLVIRVPEPAPTASTSVDAKREETEKIREEPPPPKKEGDDGEKKKKKEEQEVKIFEAPLVAAFTLHHDEQGLPRRVEPLYKPSPSEETASPTAKNFQDQLLVLHQRQVLLKQQQERLEQQQRQRQALLEQREREERQRLLEEQRLRQQLQEQQIRQQLQQQLQQPRLFFNQQQQQQQQFQFQQPSGHFFGQPSRPRHLRQEQGTANAGTVDFQRSVGFQSTDFQRPLVSNGLDFQRSVGSNNGVDFQRSVAPNPADFQRGGVSSGGDFQRGSASNGGDFQRGLITSGGNFQRGLSPNGGDFQRGLTQNGADFQRGVDFQRSVGVQLQPPPSIPFNRELLQQQQLQLLRLNSNTGFQPITSPLQQPSFNNGFQAAATFTPPFFQAPINNGFVQRPSPEAQIQNLLFPNFGGPPHEDINIVSKVLSLNHEGKKTNEISRDSQKKKAETA